MTESEMIAFGVNEDGVVAADGACENGLGEVVEEQALDGALDRTGTEFRIVALASKQVDGTFAEAELDAIL